MADARVVKWPTAHEGGVAVMADGSRREIAPTANLLDIMQSIRKLEAEGGVGSEPEAKTDHQEVLFPREHGGQGMMERMCSHQAVM